MCDDFFNLRNAPFRGVCKQLDEGGTVSLRLFDLRVSYITNRLIRLLFQFRERGHDLPDIFYPHLRRKTSQFLVVITPNRFALLGVVAVFSEQLIQSLFVFLPLLLVDSRKGGIAKGSRQDTRLRRLCLNDNLPMRGHLGPCLAQFLVQSEPLLRLFLYALQLTCKLSPCGRSLLFVPFFHEGDTLCLYLMPCTLLSVEEGRQITPCTLSTVFFLRGDISAKVKLGHNISRLFL